MCAAGIVALCGCVQPSSPEQSSGAKGGAVEAVPALRTFEPIDKQSVLLWTRSSTEIGEVLAHLVGGYNTANPSSVPVKADYIGNYDEIFKKVSAGIQARTLPSMAVAYESMTTEYAQAGAAIPLDDYINDPAVGLTREELDDFLPAVLDSNRFPDFGNRYYSFPFTKSILVMYFNRRVLAEAGFSDPPKTWDEFLEQCRQLKAKTNKFGCAITVDCSTFDGFIFSMGGEMLKDGKTLYDSPPAVQAFKLIETLVKEKLGFQVVPGTFDEDTAMSQDQLAFVLRTSSGKPYIAQQMGGYNDRWGIAVIPQTDPANPKTVLYGPNICIFNTTKEQNDAAWKFTRYFTSTEISAQWAIGSGYMPVRKSAIAHPLVQNTFKAWEFNRVPYDCMTFAKIEPNVAGWQEVRKSVEKEITAVLGGVKPAEQAAADLKREADAILARY
jgi:multiple sugar transport system substrate-binding protein